MALKKLVAVYAVPAIIGIVAISSLASCTQGDVATAVNSKSFFDYSAATGNIEPVGEPIPVTPRLLTHGEWVFRGLCIGCHGANGDGNGAVWELADKYAPEHKLPRKPRDFTQAVFKIRSTPSGSFPTDVDLFKSISRGLVADQDMPAFKYLPERDRWAVIAYIKSLTNLWQEEAEYQEDPITIGEPPVPDAAMVVAGKEVYERMKCAKCHGPLGKGDGPSAPELEDDSGLPIVPRDFSDPGQFVGASDPKGIFQTFNTGLDGTPMPSFLDFLDDEQSWQLVWYVMSLRPDFDLQETRKRMLLERGETVAALAVDTTAQIKASPATQEDASAGTESEAAQKDTEDASATAETEAEPKGTEDVSTATAETEAAPATVTQQVKVDQKDTAATGKSKPAIIGDYKEVQVSDGGSIRGKVVYNGQVKMKTVLPTKDKSVCGKVRKEPLIVVGDGGAVQDSVVFLKGVASGKPWPEMALKTPVLDQKNCKFEPHVQIGRQGKIDIINSDPVLHNTHGYYGTRTAFNVALPEQGEKVTKVLKRPGTVRVDCDAHGWMLAWVQVVDNPYFAQTGADGTFSITDVPPGDYTLVVWQETLGSTEMPVKVAAGGTTDLDVDLTK